MTKKTTLMREVEDKLGQPLIEALPEMVTDLGLSGTADELGVSKATLGYWLLKLGINVKRVALAPGETIEINRPTKKIQNHNLNLWYGYNDFQIIEREE